jgi:hypothetical protein
MVLGYFGTLIGNLIKAAVSRQREYLADASAVQFTRSPDGIAGALKRIGGLVFGSRLEHAGAAEASHMYFAEGVSVGLTSLMATHPPLSARILRIEPNWNGEFPAAPPAGAPAAVVGAAAFAGEVPVEVVKHASEQVGSPTEIHRAYAVQLIDSLPQAILEAAHEPYGARAVLYGLLFDRDPVIRARQLELLETLAKPDVVELTRQLLPLVDMLDVRARLPLVDLALPSLRAMSKAQYQEFAAGFRAIVDADERIALFEWCLHHILLRHLRPQFEPVRPRRIDYFGLQQLGDACSTLLSTLAHVGHSPEVADKAFAQAAALLPEVQLTLLPPEDCQLPRLQGAIDTLTTVSVKQRRRLIDASAACICADQEVTVREAELLRAVCDMLDCPLPPLLAGQSLSSSNGRE